MIICSAIKFHLVSNPIYPVIMTGLRHSDILEQMFNLRLVYNKIGAVQGFLTDEYQFLDRYKAKEHAISCGQIKTSEYEELYSEDIWP